MYAWSCFVDMLHGPALWICCIDLLCGSATWTCSVDPQHGPVTPTCFVDPKHGRWLLAGGHGLASGGPPRVHFGLGDTPTELTLRIFWPDGTRTTLNDVPSAGRLTITR